MLHIDPIVKANMRLHAKVCANRSNVCGDVANFRFFKMAAVRHLGLVLRVWTTYEEHLLVFVTVQNLATIGAVISIICQY